MKIKEVLSQKISIHYKEAISVAGHRFSTRDAYELLVRTDNGEVKSEFSLIPGFHKENYSRGLELFNSNPSQFIEWSPGHRYPLEVALFCLAHEKIQKGIININSYFDPSTSKLPETVYDGVKIKLGRNSNKDDLLILKSLSAKNLRLDANQSLDLKSFEEILNLGLAIDYFEEPFSDVNLIKNYPMLSFALDENLHRGDLYHLPQVKAFIIKPSLIGLAETLELIKKAKELGKRVVISSTFEGPLGHLRLCQLALYADDYLGHKELHGLGTIRFLKEQGQDIRISVSANSIQLHF